MYILVPIASDILLPYVLICLECGLFSSVMSGRDPVSPLSALDTSALHGSSVWDEVDLFIFVFVVI